MPNMLLEISGEISPERMKRQSQSKNNTQFWMRLVIEVKSDVVYCIGIWNVRSMNQGKLEVVQQEMARVNVNILGISELNIPHAPVIPFLCMFNIIACTWEPGDMCKTCKNGHNCIVCNSSKLCVCVLSRFSCILLFSTL